MLNDDEAPSTQSTAQESGCHRQYLFPVISDTMAAMTQDNVAFRVAMHTDLGQLLELIDDATEEQQRASKVTMTERIKTGKMFCATQGERIIGFIGWDTQYKKNPENWFIEQITVRKQYRGMGIGTSFLSYFVEHSKTSGAKRVFAHVQNHNINSLSMFERAGATIPADTLPENEFETVFCFELSEKS